MVRVEMGKWKQTLEDLRRAALHAPHARTRERFQVACPPKAGPVLMGVVQLAESQGATHAKTTRTRPDRQDPPRGPGRPRRRPEHQPSLPQGWLFSHHLLPLEGTPGGPRIE